MIVHFKDLNPAYFRFEGGALKRFFLFNETTDLYYINPETINTLGGDFNTPLTVSDMNNNLRDTVSEHLIFANASEYLKSNWIAKGWEADDPAFISELSRWLVLTFSSLDVNPGSIPMNLYIVEGIIDGQEYIAPCVYFGDQGSVGYVNGGPLPQEAFAKYDAIPSGGSVRVVLQADEVGEKSNLITLNGDGITDINTLMANWNALNPFNTASVVEGGAEVLQLGVSISLSGGANADIFYIDGNVETDEIYIINGGDFDIDRAPSNLEYPTPVTFILGDPVNLLPSRVDGLDITYSAVNLPTGISINTETGELSGTPTVSENVITTVTATNGLGSTDFDIDITLVADTPPSNLTYSTPQSFTLQQAITPFSPLTVDGIVESYTAPGLPAGLTINSLTGEVSGTPTVLFASQNVEIFANNSAGSTSFNVNIEVINEAPANLTYATPQTFTLTQAITPFSPLTVDGTNLVYSAPGLPSGVTINSGTGEISGTPTVLFSAQNVTVTATNDQGSTNFDINIQVVNLAPSNLTYDTPKSFEIDNAITPFSPLTVDGTNIVYSSSSLALIGLTINSSTGEISGTPDTAAVSANYTILATNDQGSDSFDINITVTNSTELISNGALTTSTDWTTGGSITAYFSAPEGATFENSVTDVLSGNIRQTVTGLSIGLQYTLLVTPNNFAASPGGTVTVYESDGITVMGSEPTGASLVEQDVDFIASDTTAVVEFTADNIAGIGTGSELWDQGDIIGFASISSLTPGTTYILTGFTSSTSFTLGSTSNGDEYANEADVSGAYELIFTATSTELYADTLAGSVTGVSVKEFLPATISYRDASLRRS